MPRENGTLLVGSAMEEAGFDDGVTDAARTYLTEVALELFPGLENARVVERWAGLRPMTPACTYASSIRAQLGQVLPGQP